MVLRRLLIAACIGLFYGAIGYLRRSAYTGYNRIGDLYFALYTAQSLLQGRDPYNFTPNGYFIPYPLPVGLVGLPLIWLPWPLASAIFVALSIGVLAFVCTHRGPWWRLWIFASLPMYVAAMYAQWSPLLLAGWYIPTIAPTLILIKPHIALPIALQRLSRHGSAVAMAVFVVSLLVYPTWPIRWLGMLQAYQRMVPLLTLPFGPLLLGALWRWRTDRGRLLLMMAVLPLRSIYDVCALWLIPQTHRQMLILTILSWLTMYLITGAGVGHAPVVPLLFLPALCFLLSERRNSGPHPETPPTPIAQQGAPEPSPKA